MKQVTVLSARGAAVFSCPPRARAGHLEAEISNVFATLAGLFDSVVQYNADNRGFEHPTVPPPPNIMSVCAAINAKIHHREISAVADYKAAISLMKAEFQPSPECLDVSYSEMVENMRNDTLGGPGEAMDRQWVWQMESKLVQM